MKLIAGLVFALLVSAVAAAVPLQTFTVNEALGHRWADELLHFDFSVPLTPSLALVDGAGQAVPCQFTDVRRDAAKKRMTGKVWTVCTLEPQGTISFSLQAGKPDAATGLKLVAEGGSYWLRNEKMALRIPQWPGKLAQPTKLTTLPPPLATVRAAEGTWFGEGKWVNEGAPISVKEATTTVVEQGPIRVTLQQKLVFTDGKSYTALISLASRQELALISEDSALEAPKAAFRFSVRPGLQPDRAGAGAGDDAGGGGRGAGGAYGGHGPGVALARPADYGHRGPNYRGWRDRLRPGGQ